jgi:copper chaperone CopZ
MQSLGGQAPLNLSENQIMETIKLTIPNMKSSHCQMTVTQAVRQTGASVKNMAPMEVEIELSNDITVQSVMEAIRKAGYKVDVK